MASINASDLRMLDNPKDHARQLRALADQLDPPNDAKTSHPKKTHLVPPIVRALEALPEVDRLISLGMTRRLAIRTTAWTTGLSADAIDTAMSERHRSNKYQKAFVIDWLARHGRSNKQIAAIIGMHEQSIRKSRARRR